MDEDEYLSERKILIELEQKVTASFEYMLLFLSSSAIALSLKFVGESSITNNSCLLRLSLIAWIISLLLQLSSRLCSAMGIRKEGELLKHAHDTKAEMKENYYTGKPTYLNFFAFLLFFIGVVSFVIFFFIA